MEVTLRRVDKPITKKLMQKNQGNCDQNVMEIGEDEDEERKNSRAIAVAVDKGKNSMYALRWALDCLISEEDPQTLMLIHVRSPILTIPTPMGTYVPIGYVCDDAATLYMKQVESQTDELLLPYLHMCRSKRVKPEIRVLENENIPKAIVECISNFNIRKIVIGSSSRNAITRRLMAPDVPAAVAKTVPNFCSVYVISKGKLSSLKSAISSELVQRTSADITSDLNFQNPNVRHSICAIGGSELRGKRESEALKPIGLTLNSGSSYHQGHQDLSNGSQLIDYDESILSTAAKNTAGVFSSFLFSDIGESSSAMHSLTVGRQRHLPKILTTEKTSFSDPSKRVEILKKHSIRSMTEISDPVNERSMGNTKINQDSGKPSTQWATHSSPSTLPTMPYDEIDVEKLELELNHSHDMYNLAREIHAQPVTEVNKLEAEKLRQECAFEIIAAENGRPEEAMEAEAAREISETETKQRQLSQFTMTRKLVNENCIEEGQESVHLKFKTYSIEEIESATDFFSESLKIGEGSYGSVYKCTLDNTTVAIKVLHQDAAHGWKQFKQEVEILSHMQHPHMVLLLGACPEYGCLVYEYMANGSLEDRLFRKGATSSLPWTIRFRIALEVATGLLFLHSSKPNQLVHRDLKPGNILLDHNFVSKIGDVGLAKLVPMDISGSHAEFKITTTSGTLCYIDPEYQLTGTLGTKSDLYALGIIFLQILTAKQPIGLAYDVERAISKGSFKTVLDQTVKDWPMKEALELAKLALKCAELQRKDRPDLETVVLPALKRLKESADSKYALRTRDDLEIGSSPRSFFCPILWVHTKGYTEDVSPTSTNSSGSPMPTKHSSSSKKLSPFPKKVFWA